MPLDIISQYKLLHDKGIWFKGTAIKGYIEEIGKVIKETGSKTILDYGCGKACFYKERKVHEGWGVTPSFYDPGVSEFSQKPKGRFDGVVCTDVLEHVEDPEMVISELLGYATKFLFISISCRHSPPGKLLPDGRPFHIEVHPPQWWRDRIKTDLRLELRFDVEAGS